MPSAKPKLSLIAKLATISGELGPIAKGQKHQQGYSFRGIDDLYNAVNPLFSKYLIFITSEILFQEVKENENTYTKNGETYTRTSYYNRVNVRFTFHDGESEEKVVTDMLAGSMDYSDKSEVQAMSMAKKYALIQVLNVTTQDTRDPDHSTAELPDKKATKPETKVYSIPEESDKFSHQLLKNDGWNGDFEGKEKDIISLNGKKGPYKLKLTELQKQAAEMYATTLKK